MVSAYIPPVQIMPKDCSDWSLRSFIDAGKLLAQFAHEGDALYRDQFIACDAHDEYMKWKLQVRGFCYKNGYLNENHHLYKTALRLRLLDLYDDTVPPLKTESTGTSSMLSQSITGTRSGIPYGDPYSPQSQILLRNIREETTKKVEILQEMEDFLSKIRIIEKKPDGNFSYKGKLLEVSKDTLWFTLFDIVYELTDGNGEISNEKIESALRKKVVRGKKVPPREPLKRNRRIGNNLGKHNGFLKYAKIDGESFGKETLPDGRPFIKCLTHRVRFNNPLIK